MLERTEEGRRARPSLPLWVREPVVLARFPGVLAAVVGASLVLALIGGAGPLFSSSVANASLREALQHAPPNALTVVAYGPVTHAFISSPDRELRRETAGLPGASPPRLSITRNGDSGRFEWDVPLRTRSLSLSQAAMLAGRVQVMREQVQDPHTALGASFNTERFGIAAPYASTRLPALVARANDIARAASGPIDTVSIAGRLLALFGLAAAGIYGVRRRRVEATLLGARGAGPLVQGARAALESVLPIAAGGVAGFLLALWMVRLVGPSTFVDPAARTSAEWTTVWTLIVALALLWLASGLAARTEFEERSSRARRVLARAPWEAVVLVLGIASLYEVLSRKGVASGTTPHIDRLLVLFPVLFIGGVAGVLVRLLGRGLARIRGTGGRWRPGPFLALRRISSAPRLALLLVSATSLAFGILAFAGTVSNSVRSSAEEKAFVRVGADVAVPLASAAQPSIPDSTVVVEYSGHSTGGGGTVLVHAIDPATFGRGVHWEASFGVSSPEAFLGRLAPASGSGIPIVVAGSAMSSEDVIDIAGFPVRVHVISRFSTLPGTPDRSTTVVLAARSSLDALVCPTTTTGTSPPPGCVPSAVAYHPLTSQGSPVLWAHGDPSAILESLHSAGTPIQGAVTAQAVSRTPSFLAVSWTFDFLEAIGAITAAVAVLGLLLYLQARQRDRDVSYALASRMGLSARAHASSVFLEILAMLVAAFVIGVGLAAAAARLILGKLDVLPSAPPPPRFQPPVTLIALIGAGVVVVAAIGAAAVQRHASRSRVSEVLRLAT